MNERSRQDLEDGRQASQHPKKEGNPVSNSDQHVNHFFSPAGSPVAVEGSYRGAHAFLVANGPSLLDLDLSPLKSRWTMTLNNGPKTFRGNANCMADDPARFSLSQWLDPTITKFIPASAFDNPLWDNRLLSEDDRVCQRWERSKLRVKDCPNVLGYRCSVGFNASQWLWEDAITWGNDDKHGGGRSVLLASLKILFLLGFRHIYLLAVDFEMSKDRKYHFAEDRSINAIQGNISTFAKLQQRLLELRPHFMNAGFVVQNCNAQSRLTAFPFVSYADALKMSGEVLGHFRAERTDGMYGHAEEKKQQARVFAEGETPGNSNSILKSAWLSPLQRKLKRANGHVFAGRVWLSPLQRHRLIKEGDTACRSERKPQAKARDRLSTTLDTRWLSPLQRQRKKDIASNGAARSYWLSPLQRRSSIPSIKVVGGPCIAKVSPEGKSGSRATRSCAKMVVPTTAAVVTCHNYGRYLDQCVQSLLKQTRPFSRVVIVDDASNDNTADVAQSFVSGYPSLVTYLRGDWRNYSAARNAGYSDVLGAGAVLFVDADNWLPSDYVGQLQRGLMRSPNIAASYGSLMQINDSGAQLGLKASIRPWNFFALHRRNLADGCALIRREAFEQAGGWDKRARCLSDWSLWIKLGRLGWRLRHVPEAVLNYRVHNAQMSRRRTPTSPLNVDALANSALVSIVTLFSGRSWSLTHYRNFLTRIVWPRENLCVVAIDNSGSAEFRTSLVNMLTSTGLTFSIRSDTPVMEDATSIRLSDKYAFASHMARLYGEARQFVPTAAGFVWSVEDDITPPSNALRLLIGALYLKPEAGIACGCARNRYGNEEWILWKTERERDTAPEAGTLKMVAGSGFYCTLFRRDIWESLAFRPDRDWGSRAAAYDWAACRDVRDAGHKIVAVGDVVCQHWQSEGAFI